MFFLVQWFISFLYQPFLNLLVGIYLILDKFTHGHGDMGIAVIIFTVIFRILWLPISLSSQRSEKEQEEIAENIKKIELKYQNDPIKRKIEVKKQFKSNRRIVIMSAFNFIFQALIALMLYKIFSKGLDNQHSHLLYSYIPKINKPFNLMFLGKYDLSKPNLLLNFIQSIVIFIYESLSALFSTGKKYRRKELISAQLFLPIVSFIFFAAMPAGKKLFVTMTIIFSIFQLLIINIYYILKRLGKKADQIAQKAAGIKTEIESKEKKMEKTREN